MITLRTSDGVRHDAWPNGSCLMQTACGELFLGWMSGGRPSGIWHATTEGPLPRLVAENVDCLACLTSGAPR